MAGFDPAPYEGIHISGVRALDDDELNELLWHFGSLRKTAEFLQCSRPLLSDEYKDRGLAGNHPSVFSVPQERTPRTGAEKTQIGEITVTDLNREADDAFERLFDAACAIDDANEALDIEQDTATYEIETEVPIGICMLSDLHIGDLGVGHRAVHGLIQGIREIDGLYVGLNGDMIEGGLPGCPDSLRMRQGMRVAWQRRLAERYAEQLQGQVFVVTTGQHEFFGQRSGDINFAAELAEQAGCPYLGPGGDFTMLVNEQLYTVGLWHKHKGSSIYDETAGAKRANREHGPYDLTIVADKHAPAVSQEFRTGNKLRTFVRGGTAKTHDEYGKALNFLDSAVMFPITVLWHDQRRIWQTIDTAGGLDYLRYLREHKYA